MEVVATAERQSIRSFRSRDRNGLIIRWLLSVVLVVAAVSKFYSMRLVYPHDAAAITEAVFETILAGWLACNVAARWASYVTLAVFVGFAAIALVKVHQAATSCGCFGAIQIPPRSIFVFDVAVVLTLLAEPTALPQYPFLARVAMGVIVVSIAGGIYMHLSPKEHTDVSLLHSPTTKPFGRTMVGKPVTPTHWVADLGIVHVDESLSVLFELTSPTGRDLQVRGVDISCACISLPDPPTIVHGQGITPAKLVIRFPRHPGPYADEVHLATNELQLPPITLGVRAQIQ